MMRGCHLLNNASAMKFVFIDRRDESGCPAQQDSGRSVQTRVLVLGLLQERQVGVGVFPKHK